MFDIDFENLYTNYSLLSNLLWLAECIAWLAECIAIRWMYSYRNNSRGTVKS